MSAAPVLPATPLRSAKLRPDRAWEHALFQAERFRYAISRAVYFVAERPTGAKTSAIHAKALAKLARDWDLRTASKHPERLTNEDLFRAFALASALNAEPLPDRIRLRKTPGLLAEVQARGVTAAQLAELQAAVATGERLAREGLPATVVYRMTIRGQTTPKAFYLPAARPSSVGTPRVSRGN